MDKKLLVSLMMTAPVALGAQAAYEANGDGNLSYQIKPEVNSANWTADGIVSAEDAVAKDGKLICPVSAGFLSHNAVLSGVGSYTFNAVNCSNVVFEVNGTKQYEKDAQGKDTTKPAMTFKIASTGNAVVIKAIPVDKDNVFEVGEVNMTLDFNFKTALDNLTAEYSKVEFDQVDDDDTRNNAKTLRERYAALLKEQKRVKAEIDAIDLDNPEALLKAWKDYDLAKYNTTLAKAGDVVSKDVLALQNSAKAYNDDVEAEKLAWKNINDNKANLATLNNRVAELQAALDAKANVEGDIDTDNAGLKAYAKLALAEDLKAQQDAIDALKAKINAKYVKDAEGNLPTTLINTAEFNTDADKIEGDIALISFENAKADWDAYATFMDRYNQLAFDYATLFGEINDKYHIEKYLIGGEEFTSSNVYDDVTGEANNALAEAYKLNDGYKLKKGAYDDKGAFVPANYELINNARNLIEEVEAEMDKRLGEMEDARNIIKDSYTKNQDQLNGSDYVYTEEGNSKVNDNPNYGDGSANAIIAGLQSTYDSYVEFSKTEAFKSLTAADQTKIQQLINAINDKIAALIAATDKAYLAHNLDVNADPFAAAKVAVDNAINNYENYLNNTVGGGVIDAIVKSNDLEAYVKSQTIDNKKVGKYGNDLWNKFASSFVNINDAIKKFRDGNDKSETSQAYKDIIASMKVVYDACNTIVPGFENAVAALGADQTAIENFEAQLNGKLLIAPEFNKKPYETKLTEFKAELKKNQDALDKIAGNTGNVQEDYQQAVKLTNDINQANLDGRVKDAQDAFVVAATEKNSANVKALIDFINNAVNVDESKDFAGMKDVDLVEGFDGLSNVKIEELWSAENGKIPGAGTDTKELDKIDKALKSIYDKCADVKAKVDAVIANHDAFVALETSKDALSNTIADYRANKLPLYTVDPAKQFYIKEFGKLIATLDEIDGRYTQSYNKVTEVKDKAGYDAEIAAVKADYEKLQKEVVANQTNFDKLSNTADGISNKINDIQATLDKYSGVADYNKDFKEDLDAITQELGNLNDKVTATFGEGGLQDGAPIIADYNAQYDKLTSDLNGLIGDWSNGYHEAVEKANDAWFAQHLLGGTNNINDLYKDAISYVNEYLYNVYNSVYYPMLTGNDTFIANHNELQACYKQIETLNAVLNAYKQFLTPVPDPTKEFDPSTQKVLGFDGEGNVTSGVVTINGVKYNVSENLIVNAETPAENYRGAQTILNTIEKTKAAIDKVGLEKANDFWSQNGEPAFSVWNNIQNRLAAAGFSVDSRQPGVPSEIDKFYGEQLLDLNSIVNAHDEAIDEIGAATTGALVHKYILDMDKWANNFVPALIPGYNPSAAAQKTFEDQKVYAALNGIWPDRVDAANKVLKALLAEIEGYALGTTEYAEQLQTVNDAIDLVKDLNTAWNGLSNANKEANLKDYQKQIDDAIEAAREAVDKADAAYKVFEANSAVLDKALAAYNTGLANIDDLLKWSGYRDNQLATIDDLRAALNDAKAEVENDVKSSQKVDEATELAKINAKGVTAVDAAYVTVFGQEKAFAQANMVLLRSAFNNVNVNAGATEAELNEWDNQIKALENALRGCNYDATKKNRGVMDTLKGIEQEISALLVTLQDLATSASGGTVDTDTKAATLDALNAVYGNVTGAIKSFKENTVDKAKHVGEAVNVKAVQAEIGGNLADLQNQLDAVKANYEGNGDNVIQNAAKFDWDMDQLLIALNGIKADWNKAYNGDAAGTTVEAKKGALAMDISINKYNELNSTLDYLWEKTQEAQAQALTHRYQYDRDDFNRINNAINGWTDANGVKHIGAKAKLESANKAYSLTASSTIYPTFADADVEALAPAFVRNTLMSVASAEKDNAVTAINELLNEVQFPGENDYGFQQSYIDADRIISEIMNELNEAYYLNLDPIVRYVSNNTWFSTNPTQAFDAYNSLMEQIDAIRGAAGDIKEAADADNLIVKGDVNDDKKVNILDVQELIRDIAAGKEYDKDSKKSHISDVNDDQELNVGDVTKLIDMVMGKGQVGPQSVISRLRSFMPAAFSGSNSYNVYEVQGENGLRRFAVLLTNETAFAAGQIDIKLPSHASVAGISLGDRANGLEAYTSDNGDYTRVLFTSFDNTLIEGNNGCVLFIDVEGNAEVEVENVIFSDKNGNAYKLNSNEASGVGILDSVKDGVKAIYNAAGQKLNKLNKGVNIIRNADGTTTKKMGK